MIRIILIAACINLISCHSQTKQNSKESSAAQGYMKIVYEQCANPDILEVETTADGYMEVEYFCDGKRYEIGIKNGILLFTERNLSLDEVPMDKIGRKLEKKYEGWIIDEVSLVSTDDTSFLKLEVLKDGIEQNLYFTLDGKWFKIRPIDVSSTLDLKAIEQNELYQSAKYLFHKPDSVYEMPELLKEISGIVINENKHIFCVQDEIGSIFEYDIGNQKIVNSHRFTDVGDFEDLAMDKNIIYVLRSDGNLFVYDMKNKSKISQRMLPINSLNIEGLCCSEGFLYVACKEALVIHDDSKRMVYRAKTDALDKIEPYLEININELSAFAAKNYPELGTTKLLFNPSAIAIHPITKDIYILSATDRFVAIYKDKQLANIIPLPSEVYYKPEGMSFYENGDLLISSEGDKKGFVTGTINLIKYRH